MSGHSKWSQIKRQKGVADKKRGQTFTKLSNAITIAVRDGGGIGDPDQNFRLRLAIEKARTVNMPKENIERAIHKAQGKLEGEDIQEVVYEGFGPGGVAIIVEAATDNKLRTNSDVKTIFEKNGGTLGVPGTVAYQFQNNGLLTVKKAGKSLDDIFLIAADAGAADVEEAGDAVFVYTNPNQLMVVKNALVVSGLAIEGFELIRRPVVSVAINDKEKATRVLQLLEKLEELDDVQKVYTNVDIPDGLI